MAGQQRVQAEEMQFIQAAIEQEQAEVLESARSALVAQEEANQILQAATVEAEGKLAIAEEEVQAVTRRANRWNTVSVAGAIGALVLAGIAVPSSITAQKLARDAQQETKDAKAQKDQLESKSNDLSKQSELLNSQLKATREKEKVAQQKAQAAQQQYQKAQQQEKAAKAQATQAMQQSQVAKQQFGIAQQQAVEAQQKEQQANQQAQAAQGQAAAAADKIQQADQQLAEANQKIVTADRQLATAQQQAAAAEKQATVAAEKTQLANRMLQAVGIQVEATKAQATGLAGQPLLGLVQGIRATGKYQQLIAQASGNESAAPSEIVEAKLQTQAVLSNVYGIQERNILKGNQGRVLSVNFSPDGQTIVSGGADGTVKLTAWDMKQLLQLACNWANDYLRSSPDVSNEDRAICGIQRRGE
jgi:hypothetical protein